MTLESTTLESTTIATTIGPLTLVADDGVLIAGGFTDDLERLRLPDAEVRSVRDLGDITKAWSAYEDGDLTALDRLPVRQPGGSFMQDAWEALRGIEPGEPVTYTELARRAGRPDAVRAAAMACARNLIAPMVPCHRVIRTDGGLGGYYWGLPVKRWLLDHEAHFSSRDNLLSASGLPPV